MNPSSSTYWNNPPPPGTEFDDIVLEEASNSSSKKEDSTKSERTIDRIDPYLKNPLYIGREPEYSSDRYRYRSRSKSAECDKRPPKKRSSSRDHHRRSRSLSRSRRRRSRSGRRRRQYSSSRSRSRSYSPHYSRRRRNKYSRRRRSRSYSRSRSRSHSRSKSYKEKRSRSPPRAQHKRDAIEIELGHHSLDGDVIKEEDMKIVEEEEEIPEPEPAQMPFKNDGSFLEMFKKMQEQQKRVAEEAAKEPQEVKKPLLPAFGKRRGGKVLKTGMVQKIRNTEDDSSNAQDAWSVYMKEVRKYKEACCDDDSKTRPLVK